MQHNQQPPQYIQQGGNQVPYNPNQPYVRPGQPYQQPYQQQQQQQYQPPYQQQQQYQQSPYGQPYQQPAYGQPYQQPQQRFVPPYQQQPQQGGTQDGFNAANSRYGKSQGAVPNAPQAQYVQPEAQVVQEVVAIPLPGNEYPLLLTPGLSAEKQNLGGFFKYVIKGNLMNEAKANLGVMVESDTDMVISPDSAGRGFNKSSSVNDLKVRAIEEGTDTYASEVISTTDYIIDAGDDPKIYHNMVTASQSIYELAKMLTGVLATTSNQYTSKFLRDADMYLTGRINDLLAHTLGSSLSIDSFMADMDSLLSYITTDVEDVELANKFKTGIENVYASLKKDIAETDSIYEELNVGKVVRTTIIPRRAIVAYTATPSIVASLDSIPVTVDAKSALAITNVSHSTLFDLIEDIYAKTNYGNTTLLTVATENGAYNIRKSTLGYYTVVKVD